MIGLFLLITSIFLYVNGNKKWSLLLFVFFMSNGLCLLTDSIIGVKNKDLALIYTVVVLIYSSIYERRKVKIKSDSILINSIYLFSIFLLLSALFSYLHYRFTFIQILQGGRHHFLFLSYFFLIKTNRADVEWILHKLFIITFITSILYVSQVLTGLPFLPYDLGEALVDKSTGLARYYNSPPLLTIFIFITILFPNQIKSIYTKYAPFVLLTAQIFTLGRIEIATTLAVLFIGLLLKEKASKLLKTALILGICVLPFIDLLVARAGSGAETNSDLKEIVNGDFQSRVFTGDMSGGTMSYRLAWIMERVLYLNNRPLGENIFGLGMISDSQIDVVNRKYNFQLGLLDEKSGYRTQLITPDIAYGNLITQFGYVGGCILFFIWLRILVISFQNRKVNPWLFCLFLVLVGYLIRSMSGSTISNSGNLAVPFLLLSVLYNPTPSKRIELIKK